MLGNLGTDRAWVVHGSDGLDELTTTGPSYVAELWEGNVTIKKISPTDIGLPHASLDQLKGGTPAENACAIRELLDGRKGAFRDIVLYGAAAALYIAGKTPELGDGVAVAASAIDEGMAAQCLENLASITSGT